MMIWKQNALITLNEPVLHTATNKSSFSAPYMNKVGASDYANPVVTIYHVAALYTLKDACHALLDSAFAAGPDALLAVSSLFCTPRVIYALFILLKLYVAVTAPGNTYGAVLDRSELKLDHYSSRLEELGGAMMEVDDDTFTSKIVASAPKFREWFLSFTDIVAQFESSSCKTGHAPALAKVDVLGELDLSEGIVNVGTWSGDDSWLYEIAVEVELRRVEV